MDLTLLFMSPIFSLCNLTLASKDPVVVFYGDIISFVACEI